VIKVPKDLIFLLGGDIKKDEVTGKWRTLLPSDAGDAFGLCNDRWRVEAAALLHKELGDAATAIIASGGISNVGTWKSGDPTIAEVIEKELVQLGVPPEIIIRDNTSYNCYQQLAWLQAFLHGVLDYREEVSGLVAEDWPELCHIYMITNDWHIPRVRTMFEHAPGLDFLRTLGDRFQWSGAEETILLRLDPTKWEVSIEWVRASDALKLRLEKEARGIEQIKAGTYKFG